MRVPVLDRIQEAASCSGRRRSRAAVATAVSGVALAGMLLAALPRPAAAQVIDFGVDKIKIWGSFTDIHCVEETDESSSADEPYVVTVAIDLSGFTPGLFVNRTIVFEDMDEGESRHHPASLWGMGGFAQPIRSRNRVIFLAALMENDDSSPEAVRVAVQDQMAMSLLAYWPQVLAGQMDRATLVNHLKTDMFVALGVGAKVTGGFNADERIGSPQEVRLTAKEMLDLWFLKQEVEKSLQFWGDGGHYKIWFRWGAAD